ncbi:MAG TPA: DUF1569 domain-containing protein [Chitinophagaceae bacterium]|nr:DUF1569 domain-containing protein [Chitinophagaceae bacterium]MCC6634229.1 DUF1569 domain-containing protein [Chitinophagaceae bacterium]HMZ45273.1 DUF1569 domain-containing protein [Chitinophagaceae bacterium]HNE92667.1 DUF1569 domain-containing protein [Chitinophagaceae bacterium]HNF28843.1 DUF1569 domain-containing protein [Chitinophagaceae bacterium]
MHSNKIEFIVQSFPALLKTANENSKPLWGKMNLQQMVEHVTEFFTISTNPLQQNIITPVDLLPKYKAFILSDKEFKENTQAPVELIPVEPKPLINASIEIAINLLTQEITKFVQYFHLHKNAQTIHPVFGSLNFDEWVLLHYKHVLHHCKQFGLV